VTDQATPAGQPLEIRALDIRGTGVCLLDIKVDDVFRSNREVGVVCHWAAHTILPFTTALRFGGDLPWESEPGLARVCCPDPDDPVVFEIRRVAVDG